MKYTWPAAFVDIKEEILSAWRVKGNIDLVRELSGHSGASILQVDVETDKHRGMAILKLSSTPDDEEIKKHRSAESGGGSYSSTHFPKLVEEYTSPSGMALLFEVAGKSLHQVQPYVRLDHSQQLRAADTISRGLLRSWNSRPVPRTGLSHPAELLGEWLRRKVDVGSRLHVFVETTLELSADQGAFSIAGKWLPNPLAYTGESLWEAAETLKILSGHVHGDLHGGNALIRVVGSDAPYYLLDFSFYRPDSPLLFDQAYFEISYLLSKRGDMHPARWLQLLTSVERDIELPGHVAEDVGIIELISVIRTSVRAWIAELHCDRTDHLTAQYTLARMAAGLNFASKRLENQNHNILAFLYAAVMLRTYLEVAEIEWEKQGPSIRQVIPAPPPSTDAWRQAWEDCDQFDPNRNAYVLVAGHSGTSDSHVLSVLGRIPWAVILDFDPGSKDSGLYAAAAPTVAFHRAVRDMLFDSISGANYQAATSWFFASGILARPDSIP